MAARVIVLAAAFCVVFAVSSPAPAAVERSTEVQPQVENSKFQFAGQINANSVNIRSGPSENYYTTAKLDKGIPVTVVGIKFDWLKIVPPEGSYSVISKAFVTRQGETNVGVVAGENVRVRAGSSVTPLKVTVQCMLTKGAPVTILGEEEEYYQIKPPTDAYVYVHQKFVDPVKQLGGKAIAGGAAGSPPNTDPGAVAGDPPTTQPANVADNAATPDASAEERQAAKAEVEFDRLEAALKSSLDKSLDQQPVTDLIAGYEALVKNTALSIPMRRISEIRLIGLRGKALAQQELLAMRQQQQQSRQKIEAIQAERKAIEEKMAGGIAIYTAIGSLQASTLQFGKGTLYRLTDPGTSRTLCYVRSEDPKFATRYLTKFVGVRGELSSEAQVGLQVVSATEVGVVEPEKVNKSVTAQISPPSLLHKPEHATTGSN
jgi:SH3-like domain-containing protein